MYIIFYNPLSSKNDISKIVTKIENHYKKRFLEFKSQNILKINNIKEYLNKFKNIDKIILLGGDGTIHKFYEMIKDANIKEVIYLYPTGTGNDFFRTLKHISPIDVIVSNVKLNNQKQLHFLNGCGLGLDGRICENIKKSKHQSFLKTSYKSISSFTPVPAEITIDKKSYNYTKVYFISIQNGKYFGKGMKIAPNANLTHTTNDIIILHSIPKIFLLLIFISVYFGFHTIFKKYIKVIKGSNVNIHFSIPQTFQTDGEVYENIQDIEITNEKGRFSVDKLKL